MARIIFMLIFAISLAGNAVAAPESPLLSLLKSPPIVGSGISQKALHDKPVIVTFFASWCPPCTQEFKTLNDIRKEFPADRLTIVAVNLFEQWGGKKHPSRMKRFLKRTSPNFKILSGNDQIATLFGNIERIPTLIIYDRDNNEVWRFVHEQGATKMSATSAEIRAVLKSLN